MDFVPLCFKKVLKHRGTESTERRGKKKREGTERGGKKKREGIERGERPEGGLPMPDWTRRVGGRLQ